MKEEKVFFPSDGIQLEGLLGIQEALSNKKGMVLCHPHPQFGGNMYNTVITTAVEVAQKEGYSTLRFNFRGVRRSGGQYGEGIKEQEDVKSAIDYLCLKLEGQLNSLILLGYSFGAMTGIPVAVNDRRVTGMVMVAPPLEKSSFEFLKGCKKDKLIIVGSEDEFCPKPILEEWYQSLEEPKSLSVIEGEDHFFFSNPRSILQPLQEFLRKF